MYLPHARQALESDLVSKYGKRRMAFMWRNGMCLYSDGRWDEAEASFTQILGMEMTLHNQRYPYRHCIPEVN